MSSWIISPSSSNIWVFSRPWWRKDAQICLFSPKTQNVNFRCFWENEKSSPDKPELTFSRHLCLFCRKLLMFVPKLPNYPSERLQTFAFAPTSAECWLLGAPTAAIRFTCEQPCEQPFEQVKTRGAPAADRSLFTPLFGVIVVFLCDQSRWRFFVVKQKLKLNFHLTEKLKWTNCWNQEVKTEQNLRLNFPSNLLKK